jgi:hypothetical protein
VINKKLNLERYKNLKIINRIPSLLLNKISRFIIMENEEEKISEELYDLIND